ncbi:hypothetical protein CMUS01_13414 [Colletotrichum musicola]|uniref:Uncharacterized protein n=1 Tax=Colletotrichum musicola TaxID=2175873 RepID=A0A8H6JCS4_9PEZI|nr:hypothetical protein CMUS01_13414 [Colletotrichum musicola]
MLSSKNVEEIPRLQGDHQAWLARVTDWTQSVLSFQQDTFPHQMGTFGVSRPQQESNVPGTFGPHAGLVIPEAAVPQPVSRASTRLHAQPGPLFGPQMKGTLTTEAAVSQPVSGSNTFLAAWPGALFGPQTHGWFSSEAAGFQPVSQTSTHLGGQPRPRLQPGPQLLGNMTSPRPGHERTIQPPAFAVHDRPTNNSHKDEDDEGPWGDALLDAGDYLPPSEPATVRCLLPTIPAVQRMVQMMSDDDRGTVLCGTPGFNEARTAWDPYAPRDANGSLVVAPAPYPGSGGVYPGSNLPTGYPPPLPWQY